MDCQKLYTQKSKNYMVATFILINPQNFKPIKKFPAIQYTIIFNNHITFGILLLSKQ